MSNTVPEGWEVKTVGDIGSVVTGSTPSTTEPLFWGGATPFISPADFDGKIYIDKTSRTLSEEGTKKARELPKDAILVTCIGSLGGMALTSKPSVTNQQINAVVAEENQESRFHFYNILFNMHELIKSAGTTTLPIINKSTFSQINLLFPPLPEQQKIATILSSVDGVIEKTCAQIDKLKDLKNGMMQELLTKGIGHTEFKDSPVGRIPAAWEVSTMQEVLLAVIDYRGKSPPKSEQGVPLITAKNIRQGYIDPEPREYIGEDQYSSWMVRGLPALGDVFITTEAPLGNVALVPKYKFAIGQRVLTLSPSETITTEYLFYTMQSRYFREQLLFESTGSTVAGIKQSTFRNILIPVPSRVEQQKIAKPLNALNDRIDTALIKLGSMEAMKKALMQDLLTGKVRVNLTDKESAVV